MAWTDLSAVFGYATTLTGSQMQALRENLFAISSGYAGAPRIQTAALGNYSVKVDNLSSEYQGKLIFNGSSHDHFTPGAAIPTAGFANNAAYAKHIRAYIFGESSTNVSNGGNYVFPAGCFNVAVDAAGAVQFQMNTGSEWLAMFGDDSYLSDYVLGGCIISDGSNTRFVNSSGATRTLYMQVMEL